MLLLKKLTIVVTPVLVYLALGRVPLCQSSTGGAAREKPQNQISVQRDFTLNGEPIHPGSLWEMRTWLSDTMPRVASVDLLGCQKSNRYYRAPKIENGWIRWRDKEQLGEGLFGYKHVGKLPNGIHVVWLSYNGGGTGIFQDLMFIRVEGAKFFQEGDHQERTLLVCVGEYSLGDRYEGSVTLDRNSVVVVGRSKDHGIDTVLGLSDY